MACSLVRLNAPPPPPPPPEEHEHDVMMNGGTGENPPKRQKVSVDEKSCVITPEIQDLHQEVERFALLLSDAIE